MKTFLKMLISFWLGYAVGYFFMPTGELNSESWAVIYGLGFVVVYLILKLLKRIINSDFWSDIDFDWSD